MGAAHIGHPEIPCRREPGGQRPAGRNPGVPARLYDCGAGRRSQGYPTAGAVHGRPPGATSSGLATHRIGRGPPASRIRSWEKSPETHLFLQFGLGNQCYQHRQVVSRPAITRCRGSSNTTTTPIDAADIARAKTMVPCRSGGVKIPSLRCSAREGSRALAPGPRNVTPQASAGDRPASARPARQWRRRVCVGAACSPATKLGVARGFSVIGKQGLAPGPIKQHRACRSWWPG